MQNNQNTNNSNPHDATVYYSWNIEDMKMNIPLGFYNP